MAGDGVGVPGGGVGELCAAGVGVRVPCAASGAPPPWVAWSPAACSPAGAAGGSLAGGEAAPPMVDW